MSPETIIFAIIIVILVGAMGALWFMLQKANKKLVTQAATPLTPTVTAPTAAELEAQLKVAYQAEIVKSTSIFATDLSATSARLSEQVSRLTTQVIEEELGAYQSTLEELRKVAAGTMEQIRASVETQRIELRKSMEADVATEREHLIEKFQAKMGDIVAGYITESLGGGIDIGSQMSYIVSNLEAHKEDIKKDLSSGA